MLVTGYRHIIGIRVLVHETLLQNRSRAVPPAVGLLLAWEAGRQGVKVRFSQMHSTIGFELFRLVTNVL